jgi:hypothetical protein
MTLCLVVQERLVAAKNLRACKARSYRPFYSNGTISSATMLMILISGLMAGPAVSL